MISRTNTARPKQVVKLLINIINNKLLITILKLYKIESNNVYAKKDSSTEFIVGIVVYAFVILMASSLFEAIEVSNFFYAIIAALILSLLNATIKPLLIVFTLPLNIITLGITYPIVNVLLLQLCDFLMGSAFTINGFFAPFLIPPILI